MKIQRLIAPCLVLAALAATPATGQDCPAPQQPQEAATPPGLVTVEVEKPRFPWVQPRTFECWPRSWSDLSFDWLSPHTPRAVETDTGLGVVARPDGVVVTSSELVTGANAITVALADGRRVTGDVVTIDSATHTALVKVEATDLPAVPLQAPPELSEGATLALPAEQGCMQQTACMKSARQAECQQVCGVYLGATQATEHTTGILAFFGGSVAPPPGAPLMTQDGAVVGVNARVSAVPLPVGAALQVVHAIPADAIQRLVSQIPPPESAAEQDPSDANGAWSWDFLWGNPPLIQPSGH